MCITCIAPLRRWHQKCALLQKEPAACFAGNVDDVACDSVSDASDYGDAGVADNAGDLEQKS